METIKVTEIIRRVYKVVLSTKHEIEIDPNEVEGVMRAVAEGAVVRVKRGIINPSYFVAVIEDEKRKFEFLEDTKHEPGRRNQGMAALKDIFADIPRLSSGMKALGGK